MSTCSLIALLLISGTSGKKFSCSEEKPFTSYDTLDQYFEHEPQGEIPGVQILMTDEAENYGALCLDGSVPDFYYRPGTGDGVTKFHIYLEGGGWCSDFENCAMRAGTSLGSTKYDAQYSNIAGGAPYLSSQQDINPLTFNWNSIFIRYCDGASYGANNDTVVAYNSTLTLYFRGFRILVGVLRTLYTKYNLNIATDVLFSGCSAGALGVYFHANYVYDWIYYINNQKEFNYMSMPDAGYFMKEASNSILITIMQFWYTFGNMTHGMDPNCRAVYNKNSLNTQECLFAQNIAPYISVKTFAMQSQYDPTQLGGINLNDTTYINNYAKYLTDSFVQNYTSINKDIHYAWLVSCYQHCNFGTDTWNNISIAGIDTSQAQVNAWFGNSTYGNVLFQDSPYPCNTCC